MSLKVEEIINGCPQFQKIEPVIGRSLLSENRTISALKPSDQINNRILLFIRRLFHQILNWLYPFEKTPYMGIVTALDTHTAKFEDMQTEELCSYLKRFFDAEGNTALQTGAEELKEQCQAIARFQELSQAASVDGQEIAKCREVLHKKRAQVVSLKEGEQSLVVYDMTAGNELFFLFSKSQGETYLKVLGRGAVLADLSDIKKAVVAGQERVVASIDYGAVTHGLVDELLNLTPLSQAQPSGSEEDLPSMTLLKNLLDPLHLESQALPDLTLEAKNNLDFLLSIFKQVGKNQGQSPTDNERMQLRFELFTLFSYLKEIRKQWTATPQDIYALERMLHICSKHLFDAHQTKLISPLEQEALVEELLAVQKTLSQIQINAKTEIDSCNMPSMQDYVVEELEGLTPALNVETPVVVPVKQTRAAHTLPQQAAPLRFTRTKDISQDYDPYRPIPEQLKALTQNATEQQIVKTLFAIPFKPFRGAHDRTLSTASPWCHFSKREAEEVLKDLYLLSDKLSSTCIKEKTIPVDVYEALIKMTLMMTFLTYNQIENQTVSSPLGALLRDVVNFTEEVSSNTQEFTRFGYAVHAENVQTNRDIHEFYYNIYILDQQAPREDKSRIPIQGLIPLQKQVDLLTYLTPYHTHRHDGFGSISAAVHHWIAPLPLPLLAAYHRLTMSPGCLTGSKYHGLSSSNSYRDTPESIQHDPVSAVKEFEELLTDEITEWRKKVHDELEEGDSYRKQDILLDNSVYGGDVRKKRLKEALIQEEEYFLQAMQTTIPLSQEELTALLSLLRGQAPQKIVMDFIQTHRKLLLHPAIRSFVQLIFFHYSILDGVRRDHHEALTDLMPVFLKEKMEETLLRIEEHPEERVLLAYFLQMSERLKGIYRSLQKNTSAFFRPSQKLIHSLLEACEQNPLRSDNVELMPLPLKLLLDKEELSRQEMCQIISGMHLFKISAMRASSVDQRELFWLNGSYAQLIKEIQEASCLDKAHIDYLLDKLCVQNGFALENAPWTGTFPEFNNGRYSIDLKTLTVKDLLSEAQKTTLPAFIIQSPSFSQAFPDFNTTLEIQALWMRTGDGTKIYSFEDAKKNRCRIEQKGQTISCYRTFAHTGAKWLQAAVLKQPVEVQEEGKPPSLLDLLKKKSAALPALFQRPCFFDPTDPNRGYILFDACEVELEVHLKETEKGRQITGVIDLRAGAERTLKQVVTCGVLSHPGLKQLEQIENPEHILVWGTENGKIEKVELPRYGLQFVIQDGALVCTTPHYAGYRVRLGASLEERRGLPCSLLLETSDRKSPQKLLLPQASALHITRIPELYSYTGLARLIFWIKLILSTIRGRLPPSTFSIVPRFAFDPSFPSLSLSCIDLRPHSQEMLFTKGQEAKTQQELIAHAFIFGLSDLALDSVNHVTIEKEEKTLYRWLDFLNAYSTKQNSSSAAMLLKLAEKLHEPLEGRKKYKKAFERLLEIEETLLISYTKTLLTLPAAQRLSQARFKEIAERVKSARPQEYQKWLAPFFLNKGDYFTIPLIRADGSENVLVPMMVVEEPPAPAKLRAPALSKLEKEIEPHKEITRESLKKSLELVTGETLLFKERVDLTSTSLDSLLKNIILPKRKTLEGEKEKARETVEKLCHFSSDPVEQLAILAREKEIASFSDLCIALMQNDLKSLESRLPTGIDLAELKKTLIIFFDLEVQLHLVLRSEEEARALLLEKGKSPLPVFEDKVKVLKEQLLYKRQYDPDKNPELLAFEAFHFVTFRNGSVGQLELLQQLLKNSASIVQAGTGSGKSSVLSVLRALMRANGTNLVTQKVLPHLYQETLTILQTRLSGTFKRKIYPLRFSQTARLVDPKGRSLFQEIYHELLAAIKNKGCVLTDYKSYVLLEQKFLSLSQVIAANNEIGSETPLITFKHWFYLAKIMHLLKNRNDELMDEFDQPLSAKQRIQTQVKEGEGFEEWMIEGSLHIYDLLDKIPELLLAKNLQIDLSDTTRMACIEKLALTLANEMQKANATDALIYDYLLGKNENVLAQLQNWTLQEKDYLTFCKDQCYTYLPLTLGRAASSNYARSDDGTKIVTCLKGQKREAKFGNPIEEINYTIQYYLQSGVARASIRTFVQDRITDWKGADNQAKHQEAFAVHFPGASLDVLASLSPDDFEDQIDLLLIQANQKPQTVRFFLERHFHYLKTGGMVISMTPQDSVAMSLAVSGVSATRGSLGSLHTQFERDEKNGDAVQEEMVKRAKRRPYLERPMMTYDPHNPLLLLEKVKTIPGLCALIDASGAFRSLPPKTVAEALLSTNKNLTRVDYYDEEGNVVSVGDPNAPLLQKGFYFPEAQTRGSDQLLKSDGVALMLTRKKGGIEDFLQEQGRMRHEQQKLIVALPQFDPIDSLDALITFKESYEKQKNSDDRYRAELQRLDHFVRDAARSDLLQAAPLDAIGNLLENPNVNGKAIEAVLNPFLKRFRELSSLLITSGTGKRRSGDYFESNQHLVRSDANPVTELNNYKHTLQEKCSRLKLVSEALDHYQAQDAQADLPTAVFPKHAIEKSEQEVEEELENELAQEEEVESELAQEKLQEVVPNKVSAYLQRKHNKHKEQGISAAMLLGGPFDPRIVLTNSYLPQNRKNPLHKRAAFDDRTGRIRAVQVVCRYGGAFEIMIGDLLDEEDFERSSNDMSFWYDIQTGKITKGETRSALPFLQNREFQELIAQIKFMDGTLNGYTRQEEAALKRWLQANNPSQMKHYFRGKILQNRPLDIDRFPASQLAQIFE